MGFQFRRGKKKGGFNFTVSNSGLGVSYGKGPVRISRGGAGRVQTNIRTPLPGLRYNIQHGKNAGARKIAGDYGDILSGGTQRTRRKLIDLQERQDRLEKGL